MIRLIGILTGSAIAVAFLIVALGVPEFAAPEATIPVITNTKDPTVNEPLLEPIAETQATAVTEIETDVESETGVEEILELPIPEDRLETVAAPEAVQNTSEPKWYAFWSPFRSKIAADGFVSQLQRTTGLDYRVVKLKPGVYEVAFAYSDDLDVQDKLAQISTATGLDLSGG